jgi:hypothetical protein
MASEGGVTLEEDARRVSDILKDDLAKKGPVHLVEERGALRLGLGLCGIRVMASKVPSIYPEGAGSSIAHALSV